MQAIILATLLSTFVPSPGTCSAQYPVEYSIGRDTGFMLVESQFGSPVDCEAVSSTARILVDSALEMIHRARRSPSPNDACAYFGSGEATLEAVRSGIVQCHRHRDQ